MWERLFSISTARALWCGKLRQIKCSYDMTEVKFVVFTKKKIVKLHTATADPQKVYFKVVTVHNETHSFQKIYYFPDWNSPKQTLLVFWALRYRAVKLTKYWDFSSSKLANFQNAIKWSIFDIFGKFWTSVRGKSLNFYNLIQF